MSGGHASGRGRRRRVCLVLAAAAAAAVPAALRLRAAALAPDPVPVLRYDAVGAGARAVAPDLFYVQMRDLAAGGFSTVSPRRLRQRAKWGRPLPAHPVFVSVGDVSPEAAPLVAEALSEYEFTALVGAEMAAAEGIGLSGAAGVAKVGGGRGADPLSALPCVRAAPGPLAFSVVVSRDAKTPDRFGTLRVSQPVGAGMPVSVLAYRPQDDAPFVQADADSLPAEGALALPLPADAAFPLDVSVYDRERLLLYHAVSVPKSAVVTPEGWRRPVAGPGGEVQFDGI